jgi:hypothetical protein
MFQERCGQPRLANTRLTGQQYHLPFLSLGLRPSSKQQFEFFFASDKLSQPSNVQGIEAALDGSWT